jgi:phosphotriesterase-related protein
MEKKLSGKVQTVLGLIHPDELGIALAHEHLMADFSCDFVEPPHASDRLLAYQPVSLENLRWVRYKTRFSLDNQKLLDEQLAVKELMLFKVAGGRTVVELTSIGSGRDPMALARISRATTINIIMGPGYYIADSLDPDVEKKTEEQMTDEIVSDIISGAEMSGVCAGIIGEVGCSWPLRDIERKSLHAAACAQQQTGLAINVHPSRNENGPLEAIEVLREAGAQLDRVVISHMERCGYLLKTHLRVLEVGCYVEYDSFGTEEYYPAEAALGDGYLPDLLNDVGRIKEIGELISLGYLKQILISQDTCQKIMLASWGSLLCSYLRSCDASDAGVWLYRTTDTSPYHRESKRHIDDSLKLLTVAKSLLDLPQVSHGHSERRILCCNHSITPSA